MQRTDSFGGVPPPGLYEHLVVHVRHRPFRRVLRTRGYVWFVDIDALPRLPLPLRPFARFSARDHMGDPRGTLRGNLERWLAERGLRLDGGPVRMLAQARVLGYVFNPLTVFWCWYPDGRLACVVAEVHNTYGERHRYLLPGPSPHDPEPGPPAPAPHFYDADKTFYVSPFFTVDGRYEMRLPPPGPRLSLRVSLHQAGERVFDAIWSGVRRPIGTAAFTRLLLLHPLAPQRVSAAIRRHGAALWLRGLPVVPRGHTASGARGAVPRPASPFCGTGDR